MREFKWPEYGCPYSGICRSEGLYCYGCIHHQKIEKPDYFESIIKPVPLTEEDLEEDEKENVKS